MMSWGRDRCHLSTLRGTTPDASAHHSSLIETAFIDLEENVHITCSTAENVQITHDGRCEDRKSWGNGKQIAFGTGPIHGNCIFKLYDLERAHILEECNKPNSADCPAWAKDL